MVDKGPSGPFFFCLLISWALEFSDEDPGLLIIFFLIQGANAQDCIKEFDKLITQYTLDPKKDDIALYQQGGQSLINKSFNERKSCIKSFLNCLMLAK